MPNVRIIAKGQRGDSLTKLKVNLAPSQPTTPSLMPETNTVYLTRPTEGTGELMELVGGTVAWNQLCEHGNFDASTGWSTNNATMSVANNVCTFTATATNGRIQRRINSEAGHVYFCAASVKISSGVCQLSYLTASANSTITGSYQRLELITKNTNTSGLAHYPRISDTRSSGWDGVDVKNVILVDLTQMFGSTIADYVYSLEQATAGSGIAWLKKYDLIDDQYHAYSAPTLQSVEATGHITKDGNGNVISTTTFGTTTLRGITELVNGTLKYNGDTYSWDGTVNRRFAEVDLGTLTWSRLAVSDHYVFWATVTDKALNFDFILAPYVNAQTVRDSLADKQAGTYNNTNGMNRITIRDDSYTDAATFKTAMSGKYCTYELATQTTESADPFTAVQTVEDGGTEEFVTTNGVPVGVVGRFANAVPMEGVDSFTVTANDGTSHTYPVTLSEKIYRGYVDMLTGEAVSDMASIAEYNGETINSPWLSSLDVYSLGATPTKGAQVVYPITPEEVTATITGDPTELGNVTSASSTEGTIEWSAMAPLDGKCIVRVV